MMLPPLCSLPREGLVFCMASEAYLIAKNTLKDSQAPQNPNGDTKRTTMRSLS